MGGNSGTFSGLVANFVATVMGIAGAVDSFLLTIMALFGIIEPQWQLCFMLVLISLMVMMVMRTLGGLFGWLALLFAAVMVLHFVVPALGQHS
ncbi:MAG: hypothetical protein KGQ26_05850 [Rhodospirillales bacterium]|nr:hypothetical protein [Rhodospirillales bacterium]MDE2320097.1 hypothetical protein [Rhodospirillales bacterium]